MFNLKLETTRLSGALSKIAVVAGLLGLTAPRAIAHTCPDGAVSTGLGLVLTAFRTNTTTHTLQPIGPAGVGACETIFLAANLSYVPFDAGGNVVAAFSSGTVAVSTPHFSMDVTPIGGVPHIGPVPSTCTPPSVADHVVTQIAPYTII